LAHPSQEQTLSSSIRTCLWFRDGRGREAAQFYCSLIPGSRVEQTFAIDNAGGTCWLINFSLGAVPYQILDAGPHFALTEAVSISVETVDQA
jgi:predicted 3-demethylubiquinone-9 3-methyltransferase (glyoxalase superfamily)